MSPYVIACIVEGHGDVQAVPVLLRRLLADTDDFTIPRPIRVGRGVILQSDALPRYLRIAEANIREAGGSGGVLVIFDADEDCAAQLGPTIAHRAAESLAHRLCRTALPVHEFETWILGGTPDIACDNSDALGAPKARLREQHGRYSETADQARLIARADLTLLQTRSRSFRKLLSVMRDFQNDAANRKQ